MIRFILNGYYRSGTTILWWIMKQSNPRMIHLYEPLHPDLPKVISKWSVGQRDGLHGLPIWDDWLAIPKHKLVEYLRRFREDHLPVNVKDVIRRFEPINELGLDVTLQPNRLHLVIGELAVFYGCKWAHIVRNPYDTWIEHFPTNLQKNERALKGESKSWDYGAMFFLQPTYELISKLEGVNVPSDDWIGKFVVCWSYCNYKAIEQWRTFGHGFVFDYETLTRNPVATLRFLSMNTPIRWKTSYAGLIKRDRVNICPDSIRKLIYERIDEYVPVKWIRWWWEWMEDRS